MAHWVKRKGKYWSLEESYRDERGKPRKRILRYFGIMEIDWRATFANDLPVDPPEVPPPPIVPNNLPPGLHVGPTNPTAPTDTQDTSSCATDEGAESETALSAMSGEPTVKAAAHGEPDAET